jgi:hypothetical protein
MDSADRDYFLDKAEVEIDRANSASQGRDAFTHLRMAAFYLDRANDGAANDDDAVLDVLV